MGNLSSCINAAPTAKPVIRVLLIDGSMLKFRSPVRVIQLLLDYPNHVICPLDSLKPGLHSLSILLPDEKLQLGRLYLLLPFKENVQQSCIKRKRMIRQPKDSEKLVQQRQQQHSQTIREGEERANLLPKDTVDAGFAKGEKSKDVIFSECSELNRHVDIGRRPDFKLQSSCLAGDERNFGKTFRRDDDVPESIIQRKEKQNFMRKVDMMSFSLCSDLSWNNEAGKRYVGRYNKLSDKRKGKEIIERSPQFNSSSSDDLKSPLCDTPELQRAYRSLLRRSVSWTPRLQPILERR